MEQRLQLLGFRFAILDTSYNIAEIFGLAG